jgi:hypothetical protein
MGSMSAITTQEAASVEQDEEGDSQFKRLQRVVREGWAARGPWRVEAQECFDFTAGHQWSKEDKQLLQDQNRPAVSFNRIAPIVKAVCGLEVNNRQGIVYLPRTADDDGPDEVRTAAVKWVRDECNAEYEESDSFRDTVICGEGCTETRMEYDEDPKGKIIEERIFPLEMGVNVGAEKANYKDARAVFRIRDKPVQDAKEMFPGYEAAAIDARWISDSITPADGGQGNKKDYPDETRAALGTRTNLKRCRLVQVQWWELKQVHMVAQAGQDDLQELSPEDFAKYEARIQQMNAAGQEQAAMTGQPYEDITYDHVKLPKRCYYEAFLGNTGILTTADGKGVRELENGFQFRFMTGERDSKKKCFYGLVRDMIDPQRWANKWLSQTMHIMNTNAKGGIIAEKTAFANQRAAEKDWADNTKIVWVKDGKLDKVKDRNPPPFPQGLENLMTFAISSLRDVSGINLELLGQADREQAASLEMQRRQSAMTILATIFDSLRRYREGQGRLLLYFIDMLPPGTLIRVTEKGNYKYIPLVKNEENVEYDVIVDEAPSSPNQKQAQWAIISQLLQSGIQFPPAVIFKLLKYSPLAESVVAEIEAAAGFGDEMPPEQMKQKLSGRIQEGNEETGLTALSGKVDQLAQMLGQLMQALGQGQPSAEPVPPTEPQAQPAML